MENKRYLSHHSSYKVFLPLFLFLTLSISAQVIEPYNGKYDEPFRPQFHFTPQQKWMNDPNGMVFFNGKYHLFYQYYPYDIVWGPMHWGHAESRDLIHWKHLLIALYPDSLGNIFSGSAVIDKDNTAGFSKNAMVAIFTYHNDEIWKAGKKNTESKGIAYSNDEGKTWTKYKGNPVLHNSGEQDFRDPKVFRFEKNKCWIMVLAAGDRIKFFSSQDLKKWKFESDFKPEENIALGVWECPDLFNIKCDKEGKEKWVLIINHGDQGPNGGSGTRYFVGDFNGSTFKNIQPSKWLDSGTDFYAAVTFGNVPANKRILLGWMSNWQYATRTPTAVWRSAMTLPRVLKLIKGEKDYFLIHQPVELKNISTPLYSSKKESLPFVKQVTDLMGSEISFEMPGIENDFSVEFKNSAGEFYKIEIKGSMFSADRSKSGKTDFGDKFAGKVQTMLLGDDKIKSVKMILDKSSIEIFLNGGKYSFTNQIFPNQPYTDLILKSGKVNSITNFKINKIKSVWN